MLLDEPKPDQVLELERALGRVLLPYVEDEDAAEHLWWDDEDVARDAEGWDPRGSILGQKNRKCYRVNARGEITGLNLRGCGLTDAHTCAVKVFTALEELDLSDNRQIADYGFLARLEGLRSLDLTSGRVVDPSRRYTSTRGPSRSAVPRPAAGLRVVVASVEVVEPRVCLCAGMPYPLRASSVSGGLD